MAEATPSKLRVSKEEAYQKIQAQIEKGQQLRVRRIDSYDELEDARADFVNWSEYNEKLLLVLFDNSSIVDVYNKPYDDKEIWDTYDLVPNIDKYRRDVTTKIKRLGGISDQLVLFNDPSDTSQPTFSNEDISNTLQPTFSDEVFIVHGHDEAAKHAGARFVEKLGLNAIILDEQVSRGQTIIEKLEQKASNADFAIVLLTPDDMGAPKDKLDELKPRARQNVVLELGYFLRGLGRERVCVLHKEKVELPSDIHGIIYVPMDDYDGWQNKLRQEIEHAGLPVQNR
jgi:predicted nucleotide-binding protein